MKLTVFFLSDKMEETQTQTTTLLVRPTELVGDDGDYAPVRSYVALKKIIWIESIKTWRIAVPIAVNIFCLFGINSITSIFVGHIGNLELSAAAISLSVIGTFAFGFMVCTPIFTLCCCCVCDVLISLL